MATHTRIGQSLGPARLLALCFLCFASVTARADDRGKPGRADVVRAKQLYEAGKEAYAAGRFGAAARAFEESYRVTPLPAIAFSMAQAYRRQYVVDDRRATLERAIELYRAYLKAVPQGGRRGDAVELIEKLEEIRRQLGDPQAPDSATAEQAPTPALTELIITSPTLGATGSIDGETMGEMPIVAKVVPGSHTIVLNAPGYFDKELEVTALEGRPVPVALTLQAKPALLRVQRPKGAEVYVDGQRIRSLEAQLSAGSHRVRVVRRGANPVVRDIELKRGERAQLEVELQATRQRIGSYWVFGAAGLVVISAGVSTAVALTADSDAEDIRNRIGIDILSTDERDAHNRYLSRRNRWKTLAEVLWGSAALLGSAGALLYFLDNPTAEQGASGWRISPMAGDGAVGATLGGVL